MYNSVRWGVPVRGTLILSRRHSEVGWPVPFLAAFNFPSVATRYPFAAGSTVSEHPNYDPRVRLEPSMFRTEVKRSNHLTTRPSDLIYEAHTGQFLYGYILKMLQEYAYLQSRLSPFAKMRRHFLRRGAKAPFQ